jgi:hypothetical protein
LRHLVECCGGAAAIHRAQMDGRRIVGRRRPGRVADLLDIGRPADREGLRAPHGFEQITIGSLRGAIHRACDVRKPHFDRIDRRAFGLLGRGIAKASPGRAHIPEIAAHEIALTLIVVQHRR